MALGVNLYPPIIDSFMPAFIYNRICRVYFSLSSFNSEADINHVQVTVKSQLSNKNMLKSNKWANGIKIAQLSVDSEKTTNDKYYITLDPSEIIGDAFQTGQCYKVQIRFSSIGVPADSQTDAGPSASFFANNTSSFSEWSTVCLIRGINKPEFDILDLEEDTAGSNTSVTISSLNSEFVATYKNEEESETLRSWRMRLFSAEDINREQALSDSGIVMVNNYNFAGSFSYTFPYSLSTGEKYTLVVDITTKNLYEETKAYSFTMVSYNENMINGTLSAEVVEEEGYARVVLAPKAEFVGEIVHCNITIRRASSENNFTIWEDVKNYTITNGTLDIEFDDYTIESGIWYQYAAQQRDNQGRRGVTVKSEKVHGVFEDAFLVRDGRQLKIKYNPEVSSYRTTVSENKTDTIGSQFPLIRRNGNTYYRQFSLSGLITHYCDAANLFTSEDEIYKYSDVKTLYNQKNNLNNITEHNDYIYERKFRELVESFLYDNSVKLFKSTTEGNILVKLMDVSFTPKIELGRMLYSFTATAYEIAESNIKNYNSYGIQTIGDYSTNITFSTTHIGQMMGSYNANTNIMDKIKEKYHYNNIIQGMLIKNLKLTFLRLEVNSKPYLIVDNGGTLEPLGNRLPTGKEILGTLVRIDGTTIVIGPNGIYEMRDANVEITSEITVFANTDLTLDFVYVVDKEEDTSGAASKLYYSNVIGQLWGTFESDTSLITKIYYKYYEDYSEYYKKVISVNTAWIEANPNTVIYMQESLDDTLNRFVIGPTNILAIEPDDDVIISKLYFGGEHLPDVKVLNDTGLVVSDFNEIKNPKTFDTCNYNNMKYVYYKKGWYKIDNLNDIHCPIDASVNYYVNIVKGVY